jgi:chemotaxis protein methyltransferase CheR
MSLLAQVTGGAAGAPAPAAAACVSPTEFAFLRGFLLEKCAIQIEPGQEYLVDSRLSPVARQYQLPDIPAVIAQLRAGTSAALANDVIDAMTTNETSFFRDQHPFTDLVDHVIPDILAKKGPAATLTIWCAACSSGQEPYTLAMLLHENFPHLVSQRRVQILATDLSPTMVKRTQEGRYSQFEVNRGLPAKLMVTYFEQTGRDWTVRADLRSLILAKPMNLIAPFAGIPRCDLVLIRNVLIYFPTEVKKNILDRIASGVLTPDGYLMLGSSESLLTVGVDYETRRFERASFYQPRR